MRSNESMTEANAKDWVMKHTWRREDMFKFFSHDMIGEKHFPCSTNGGLMIGRPCVFPFKYPDCNLYPQPQTCMEEQQPMPTTYNTCKNGTNGVRWCPTRTYNNMTSMSRDGVDMIHYTALWSE